MSNYKAFITKRKTLEVKDLDDPDFNLDQCVARTDTPWSKMITPCHRGIYVPGPVVNEHLYFALYPKSKLIVIGRDDYVPPGMISKSTRVSYLFNAHEASSILKRCTLLPLEGCLLINQNLECEYFDHRYLREDSAIGWTCTTGPGNTHWTVCSDENGRMSSAGEIPIIFSQEGDFTGVIGIRIPGAALVSYNGVILENDDGLLTGVEFGVGTLSIALGKEPLGNLEFIYE